MFALLEFILWLVVLPFFAVALFGVMIAQAIAQMFHPTSLFFAGWFAFAGSWLLMNASPPDSPFGTIVDMLIGMHVPHIFIGVAALMLCVSVYLRARNPL